MYKYQFRLDFYKPLIVGCMAFSQTTHNTMRTRRVRNYSTGDRIHRYRTSVMRGDVKSNEVRSGGV